MQIYSGPQAILRLFDDRNTCHWLSDASCVGRVLKRRMPEPHEASLLHVGIYTVYWRAQHPPDTWSK
jgi:hypothetical protein